MQSLSLSELKELVDAPVPHAELGLILANNLFTAGGKHRFLKPNSDHRVVRQTRQISTIRSVAGDYEAVEWVDPTPFVDVTAAFGPALNSVAKVLLNEKWRLAELTEADNGQWQATYRPKGADYLDLRYGVGEWRETPILAVWSAGLEAKIKHG